MSGMSLRTWTNCDCEPCATMRAELYAKDRRHVFAPRTGPVTIAAMSMFCTHCGAQVKRAPKTGQPPMFRGVVVCNRKPCRAAVRGDGAVAPPMPQAEQFTPDVIARLRDSGLTADEIMAKVEA